MVVEEAVEDSGSSGGGWDSGSGDDGIRLPSRM